MIRPLYEIIIPVASVKYVKTIRENVYIIKSDVVKLEPSESIGGFFLYNNQKKEFEKLQRFESLDKFNESFYNAMKEHKDAFTKGELIALKTLKNWGAKIVGVVYAKLGTILSDLIKRKGEMFTPSRSTFERAIRKAKRLGIIDVLPLKQGSDKKNRKNLKGNNLYIFRIFSDNTQLTERKEEQLTERGNAENPQGESVQQEQNTGDTLKTFDTSKSDLKDIHKELDSSYLQNYIPRFFVSKMQPFYFADVIDECFRASVNIFNGYHKKGYKFVDRETYEEHTEEAIKSLIKKERKEARKGRKFNTVGYFISTFKRISQKLAMEENASKTVMGKFLLSYWNEDKTPIWLSERDNEKSTHWSEW